MSEAIARTRAAIDAAHAEDPEGRELGYADAVEAWLLRLVPDADPVLRLAARAQHLKRWELPRSAYPMDRVGYHRWRTEQYRRQGALAQRLATAAGLSPEDAVRLDDLVAKRRLAQPDGQAIEDAACLVFLEREMQDFAAGHPDYTPERYLDILRRTMHKMSVPAREAALALPLPEPFAGLVRGAAATLRSEASA